MPSWVQSRSLRAWCVSIVDLVNFYAIREHGSTNKNIPASQVGLPTLGSTSGYTLEAIVTGTNSHQSVNASILSVTAQKPHMINGHQVWQTLPSGRVQCEDCATIGITTIPEGTERFSVDVALPEAAIKGVVHLAAWASGGF